MGTLPALTSLGSWGDSVTHCLAGAWLTELLKERLLDRDALAPEVQTKQEEWSTG